MRAQTLARAQGIYFFLTGVWPLLSMRTFEAVTGPKRDRWLVKTVGVLVAVIGATLATVARPSTPTSVLAVGSAAGLGAVDVVYSLKGRISRVYLLDAVLEALLVVGWLAALRPGSRRLRGATTRRTRRASRSRASRASSPSPGARP
jgi:hypothetical protein